MADSTLDAIKGVLARLGATAALTSITMKDTDDNGIYTDVPQDISAPYCVLEIAGQPWAQFDSSGMVHTLRLHGFSENKSPVEATQIKQACFDALDRQESNVSLDSGEVVLLRYSGLSDAFKEPDGITWHSIIEFELTIK